MDGRDHTLEVDPFVRQLAGIEADADGVFRGALERHQVEQWPGLERELFASLYGASAPVAEVAGADGWLQAIHAQAEDLEEWRDLQRRCESDPWAAGIGAGRVTQILGQVLDEAIRKLAPQQDPVRLEQEAAELEELAAGAGAMAEQAAEAAELASQALSRALAEPQTELKLRQAIRQAADEAEGEIREIQVAMAGLGCGGGPGSLSSVQAPSEAVRKALQQNPKLRRVAEIGGRMRIRARAKQRAKVEYLPEQIVDVTIGGELSLLLPSELVLLAAEETELLAIKKLIERQALQLRLEGQETLDKGPVILCVDGSGSMNGARNEWAMGVALALLEVCASQSRPFCLVHFDQKVQKTFEIPNSGRVGLDRLVEMVSYFSGGGTDFAPPLDWAQARLGAGAWKRSDVILVTDGGGDWGDAAAELKACGASLYGVAIDCDFSDDQKAELTGCARVLNLTEGASYAARPQKGVAQDGPVDLVFGI